MKASYQRDCYRDDKRKRRKHDDSYGDWDYSPYSRQKYFFDDICDYCPYFLKDQHDSKKDDDKKKDRRDSDSPRHETETILKCGNSVGSGPISCNTVLVNGAASSSLSNSGLVQATVALDSSDLIDPTIKLDFSSLISFRTTDNNFYLLRLLFKLSRVYNGSHIPLGTWTFERQSSEQIGVTQIDSNFVQQTDSFVFSFCTCESCPGCCTYIVELVSQECINIAFATINNISLSALAVGKNSKKKAD